MARLTAAADDLPLLDKPRVESRTEYSCPRCKGRLLELKFHPEANIVLDRCEKCEGIWFDRKEFARVKLLRRALGRRWSTLLGTEKPAREYHQKWAYKLLCIWAPVILLSIAGLCLATVLAGRQIFWASMMVLLAGGLGLLSVPMMFIAFEKFRITDRTLEMRGLFYRKTLKFENVSAWDIHHTTVQTQDHTHRDEQAVIYAKRDRMTVPVAVLVDAPEFQRRLRSAMPVKPRVRRGGSFLAWAVYLRRLGFR